MSEFLRYVLWELKRYSVLALLAAILLFAVLCVFRWVYRRKYGADRKLPWSRFLLPVLFAGYLALVFFVTNFRASGIYRQVNLHLFRAWREALNTFSQQNWLNVMLNIAMFSPFGFLLPALSRRFRKWYLTIPAGFLYSLLLELLQLMLARGVFDVDDLFCNTVGCMVGFFLEMTMLSLKNEKGRRWKPVLTYSCLQFLFLTALGGVFVGYHVQEFGNLSEAPVYRVPTGKTEWTLECELPEIGETAAVYQTKTRSASDCDAFAEAFKVLIPTEFEDVSYYQEAAYYMDHGSENGAHFLFVHYLDPGYEYSAHYDDAPIWVEADRESVLKALEKFPYSIPDSAEFTVLGEGWHSFSADKTVDGTVLLDGVLRVRIAADGSVREIKNGLHSYGYYRDAAVISPQEAYRRLCAGKFQDGDFFEMKNPAHLSVLSCALEYRVDTKGFYQPVYVFEVASPDGDYFCRIVIPALQ